MTVDTAAPSRRAFGSKKELAAWLAEKGIQLAAPLKQSKGAFTVVPVLPPSGGATMYQQSFRIGGSGLQRASRWSYTPATYRDGERRDMTAEERELEDVRIGRLNEIDDIITSETVRVYLHTH